MKILRTTIVATALISTGLGVGTVADAAPIWDSPGREIPGLEPSPTIPDWIAEPGGPCGFDGSSTPATPAPDAFAELDLDGDGADDVVLAHQEVVSHGSFFSERTRVRVETSSGRSSEVTFRSDRNASILGVINFGTGHAVLFQSSEIVRTGSIQVYSTVTAVSIDSNGCAFSSGYTPDSTIGIGVGANKAGAVSEDGVPITSHYGVSCRNGVIVEYTVSSWNTRLGVTKYQMSTWVTFQSSAGGFVGQFDGDVRDISAREAREVLTYDCPGILSKW